MKKIMAIAIAVAMLMVMFVTGPATASDTPETVTDTYGVTYTPLVTEAQSAAASEDIVGVDDGARGASCYHDVWMFWKGAYLYTQGGTHFYPEGQIRYDACKRDNGSKFNRIDKVVYFYKVEYNDRDCDGVTDLRMNGNALAGWNPTFGDANCVDGKAEYVINRWAPDGTTVGPNAPSNERCIGFEWRIFTALFNYDGNYSSRCMKFFGDFG